MPDTLEDVFGYRLAWDLDEIALYTPLLRVEHADTADIAESWRTLRQFVQPAGRCHTCADEPIPRATSNPSVQHLRSPLPTADTKRTDAPVPPAADIGSSELTGEPLGHQTCADTLRLPWLSWLARCGRPRNWSR